MSSKKIQNIPRAGIKVIPEAAVIQNIPVTAVEEETEEDWKIHHTLPTLVEILVVGATNLKVANRAEVPGALVVHTRMLGVIG